MATLQDNLSFTGTTSGTSVHLNTVPASALSVVTVCVNNATSNRVTSVTDNAGNTYTRASSIVGTGIDSEVWYCLGIVSLGNSHTITVTCPSGDLFSATWAIFSGVSQGNAVDVIAGASGTGTSLSSGATASTANAYELVIGYGGQGNNRPFTASGSYTSINQASNGTSAASYLSYLNTTTTGAQTATATIDISSNWTMGAICFKRTEIIQTMKVSSTNVTGGNVTTTGVTTTAGNTLIVCASSMAGTANALTISDNKSNVFTRILSNAGGTGAHAEVEMWYAPITTGGSSHTVSSTGGSSTALIAQEWCGLDPVYPLGQSANASGNSAAAAPGSTGNNAVPNGVAVSCFAFSGAGGGSSGTGGLGFDSIIATNAGNDAYVGNQYQYFSTNAALSPTFANTSGTWEAGVATFFEPGPNISQAFTAVVATAAASLTSAAFTSVSGRTLVVATNTDSSTATMTVTDSKGNTWTRILQQAVTAGTHTVELWYAYNITGGSSHTITATSSVSTNAIGMVVYELTGMGTGDPLDGSVITQAASGTALDSGAPSSTTGAPELVIGIGGAPLNNGLVAGTNFGKLTQVSHNRVAQKGVGLEARRVYTNAAYNGIMSIGSSQRWAMGVAAFKYATAGGGGGSGIAGNFFPWFFRN